LPCPAVPQQSLLQPRHDQHTQSIASAVNSFVASVLPFVLCLLSTITNPLDQLTTVRWCLLVVVTESQISFDGSVSGRCSYPRTLMAGFRYDHVSSAFISYLAEFAACCYSPGSIPGN
jgi:hypothetical protein